MVLLAVAVIGMSAPLPLAAESSSFVRDVGSFALTERSGRTVTERDLAGTVWIAGFVFTRCTGPCPVITARMAELQGDLADTGVRLVSISVDPSYDTPAVLSEYARAYDADPDRWWFLTGDGPVIHRLVREGFALAAERGGEGTPVGEIVTHSDRLALVDAAGRVRGYYRATDREALAALREEARHLAGRADLAWMPRLNAGLNGASALCLVAGFLFIRRKRVGPHRVCMGTAVVLSVGFLVSYLIYHAQAGATPFPHHGPVRILYFTILISHTILAATVPFLVGITLFHAFRGTFDRHRRIARWTLPIWLYVSLTGVAVYGLLYHV